MLQGQLIRIGLTQRDMVAMEVTENNIGGSCQLLNDRLSDSDPD